MTSATDLVQGDPLGNSVAKALEADPGVVDEVFDNLGRIGKRAIAVLEGLGVVPMEDGHYRFDAFGDEGIDL